MIPTDSNSVSTRPWRIIDLTGQAFGRLTVLGLGERKNRKILWKCKCTCGNEKNIAGHHLRSGATKSCGCLTIETITNMVLKHGQTRGKKNSPEYSVWAAMKRRCDNTKTIGWSDYGGRGIIVCQRWRDSFQHFLDDMGLKPSPSHSLDRIDNDGNYELGNCKWATKSEQALNRRPRRVCWHGHPLTEDNVIGRRRRCRICSEAQAIEYAKHKPPYAYPEKTAAHRKVKQAIRSGNLKQQYCEICENPKTIAHHEDYDKPLDVHWLCISHHQKRHHQIEIPWDTWLRSVVK